jgi:hypothetical protein
LSVHFTQIILKWRRFKFVQTAHQGEIIAKEKKKLLNFFLDLFQNRKPISIKLDTNHPWMKGPQARPLQKGDNQKNAKLVWGSFKNPLLKKPVGQR